MTTATEVLTQLEPLFRDIFDIPSLSLRAELAAKDLEEWDSLNHIRIVSAAEQRFGVQFTTAEIERLNNVGEFADLIASRLKG